MHTHTPTNPPTHTHPHTPTHTPTHRHKQVSTNKYSQHTPKFTDAIKVRPSLCRLSRNSDYWTNFGKEFSSTMAQQHIAQRSHHSRGFTIILRHNTVRRTPLDEWSACRRDLYLTTHNTHNRQTSMSPGIRTHDLSRRAAVDQRFRQRGCWYLPKLHMLAPNICDCSICDLLRVILLAPETFACCWIIFFRKCLYPWYRKSLFYLKNTVCHSLPHAVRYN